ncbi:MAG: hypothetical protein RBU37_24010 [Myxococcota bacterium]|nr:hypothetical protein [Myxococcota bacterium]
MSSWRAGVRLKGPDGVESRALPQSFGYDGVSQASAQSQLDCVAWLGTQTSRGRRGPGE